MQLNTSSTMWFVLSVLVILCSRVRCQGQFNPHALRQHLATRRVLPSHFQRLRALHHQRFVPAGALANQQRIQNVRPTLASLIQNLQSNPNFRAPASGNLRASSSGNVPRQMSAVWSPPTRRAVVQAIPQVQRIVQPVAQPQHLIPQAIGQGQPNIAVNPNLSVQPNAANVDPNFVQKQLHEFNRLQVMLRHIQQQRLQRQQQQQQQQQRLRLIQQIQALRQSRSQQSPHLPGTTAAKISQMEKMIKDLIKYRNKLQRDAAFRQTTRMAKAPEVPAVNSNVEHALTLPKHDTIPAQPRKEKNGSMVVVSNTANVHSNVDLQNNKQVHQPQPTQMTQHFGHPQNPQPQRSQPFFNPPSQNAPMQTFNTPPPPNLPIQNFITPPPPLHQIVNNGQHTPPPNQNSWQNSGQIQTNVGNQGKHGNQQQGAVQTNHGNTQNPKIGPDVFGQIFGQQNQLNQPNSNAQIPAQFIQRMDSTNNNAPNLNSNTPQTNLQQPAPTIQSPLQNNHQATWNQVANNGIQHPGSWSSNPPNAEIMNQNLPLSVTGSQQTGNQHANFAQNNNNGQQMGNGAWQSSTSNSQQSGNGNWLPNVNTQANTGGNVINPVNQQATKNNGHSILQTTNLLNSRASLNNNNAIDPSKGGAWNQQHKQPNNLNNLPVPSFHVNENPAGSLGSLGNGNRNSPSFQNQNIGSKSHPHFPNQRNVLPGNRGKKVRISFRNDPQKNNPIQQLPTPESLYKFQDQIHQAANQQYVNNAQNHVNNNNNRPSFIPQTTPSPYYHTTPYFAVTQPIVNYYQTTTAMVHSHIQGNSMYKGNFVPKSNTTPSPVFVLQTTQSYIQNKNNGVHTQPPQNVYTPPSPSPPAIHFYTTTPIHNVNNQAGTNNYPNSQNIPKRNIQMPFNQNSQNLMTGHQAPNQNTKSHMMGHQSSNQTPQSQPSNQIPQNQITGHQTSNQNTQVPQDLSQFQEQIWNPPSNHHQVNSQNNNGQNNIPNVNGQANGSGIQNKPIVGNQNGNTNQPRKKDEIVLVINGKKHIKNRNNPLVKLLKLLQKGSPKIQFASDRLQTPISGKPASLPNTQPNNQYNRNAVNSQSAGPIVVTTLPPTTSIPREHPVQSVRPNNVVPTPISHHANNVQLHSNTITNQRTGFPVKNNLQSIMGTNKDIHHTQSNKPSNQRPSRIPQSSNNTPVRINENRRKNNPFRRRLGRNMRRRLRGRNPIRMLVAALVRILKNRRALRRRPNVFRRQQQNAQQVMYNPTNRENTNLPESQVLQGQEVRFTDDVNVGFGGESPPPVIIERIKPKQSHPRHQSHSQGMYMDLPKLSLHENSAILAIMENDDGFNITIGNTNTSDDGDNATSRMPLTLPSDLFDTSTDIPSTTSTSISKLELPTDLFESTLIPTNEHNMFSSKVSTETTTTKLELPSDLFVTTTTDDRTTTKPSSATSTTASTTTISSTTKASSTTTTIPLTTTTTTITTPSITTRRYKTTTPTPTTSSTTTTARTTTTVRTTTTSTPSTTTTVPTTTTMPSTTTTRPSSTTTTPTTTTTAPTTTTVPSTTTTVPTTTTTQSTTTTVPKTTAIRTTTTSKPTTSKNSRSTETYYTTTTRPDVVLDSGARSNAATSFIAIPVNDRKHSKETTFLHHINIPRKRTSTNSRTNQIDTNLFLPHDYSETTTKRSSVLTGTPSTVSTKTPTSPFKLPVFLLQTGMPFESYDNMPTRKDNENSPLIMKLSTTYSTTPKPTPSLRRVPERLPLIQTSTSASTTLRSTSLDSHQSSKILPRNLKLSTYEKIDTAGNDDNVVVRKSTTTTSTVTPVPSLPTTQMKVQSEVVTSTQPPVEPTTKENVGVNVASSTVALPISKFSTKSLDLTGYENFHLQQTLMPSLKSTTKTTTKAFIPTTPAPTYNIDRSENNYQFLPLDDGKGIQHWTTSIMNNIVTDSAMYDLLSGAEQSFIDNYHNMFNYDLNGLAPLPDWPALNKGLRQNNNQHSRQITKAPPTSLPEITKILNLRKSTTNKPKKTTESPVMPSTPRLLQMLTETPKSHHTNLLKFTTESPVKETTTFIPKTTTIIPTTKLTTRLTKPTTKLPVTRSTTTPRSIRGMPKQAINQKLPLKINIKDTPVISPVANNNILMPTVATLSRNIVTDPYLQLLLATPRPATKHVRKSVVPKRSGDIVISSVKQRLSPTTFQNLIIEKPKMNSLHDSLGNSGIGKLSIKAVMSVGQRQPQKTFVKLIGGKPTISTLQNNFKKSQIGKLSNSVVNRVRQSLSPTVFENLIGKKSPLGTIQDSLGNARAGKLSNKPVSMGKTTEDLVDSGRPVDKVIDRVFSTSRLSSNMPTKPKSVEKVPEKSHLDVVDIPYDPHMDRTETGLSGKINFMNVNEVKPQTSHAENAANVIPKDINKSKPSPHFRKSISSNSLEMNTHFAEQSKISDIPFSFSEAILPSISSLGSNLHIQEQQGSDGHVQYKIKGIPNHSTIVLNTGQRWSKSP